MRRHRNDFFNNDPNNYSYGRAMIKCPDTLRNPNDIIISKEYNQGGSRVYYVFRNYKEFEDFYTKKIGINERHVYEVILSSHRFYIDVDVDLTKNNNIDEQELLNEIVKAIIKVFGNIQIDKDIFLYSSHGPTKKSFHILVHRAVNNYNISLKIIKLIKENVREDLRKFIDEGVYKPKQQLRILYSSKFSDPTRIKIFEGQWRFEDQWIVNPIKKEDELKYSLVTLLLDSENVSVKFANLKSEDKPDAKQRLLKNPEDDKNSRFIKDVAHRRVIEDLEEFFKEPMKREDLIPCEVKPYLGNYLLILRNKHGYTCPVHKKIHDRENPFVYFTLDSSYFHCRRKYDDDKGYRVFCMRQDNKKIGEPVKGIKSLYYEKLLDLLNDYNDEV